MLLAPDLLSDVQPPTTPTDDAMLSAHALEFTEIDLAELSPQAAVNDLLDQAVEMEASDLYFMSDEDAMNVAVRRLGVIEQIASVDATLGKHYISHVKALAGLDLAERRRPLDGRWIHNHQDNRFDVRINVIPTLFGSDLTMRLLSREKKQWTFDQLGLSSAELGSLRNMLTSPSGLILVTGPTGAGKTTTLYTCLNFLNDGRHKINTLEDPIEYSIPGVRQSQVNPRIDLDFAQLLRSILRQAPDVIMVGEIRDPETAAIAVRAAHSGHLVCATLHAPVAAGAIHTMLNMGVPAHLLANCLLGIVAQRLIRTLCPHCRVAYEFPREIGSFDDLSELLQPGEGEQIFGAGGCAQCFGHGYSGRQGVFELLEVSNAMRSAISKPTPSVELHRMAVDHGMIEFRRGALAKVARGITSIEEVVRTVPGELLGNDQ